MAAGIPRLRCGRNPYTQHVLSRDGACWWNKPRSLFYFGAEYALTRDLRSRLWRSTLDSRVGTVKLSGRPHGLGVWAAGNLARPVEGDWHRRSSAWVVISAGRQKRDPWLVSHSGNHL